MDFEDIPDFLNLKIPANRQLWELGLKRNRGAARRAAYEAKRDYSLPKSLDAAGKAMIKDQRREKAKKLIERRKARKRKP